MLHPYFVENLKMLAMLTQPVKVYSKGIDPDSIQVKFSDADPLSEDLS